MKNELIYNIRQPAEIALCNLASINVKKFANLAADEQAELAKTIVRALDNAIDLSFYPVADSELNNKKYRYLGIGLLNLTNWLASLKLEIDSPEALEKQDVLMDQISYLLYDASCELAQERGPYPQFNLDNNWWKVGKTPVHMSKEHFPQVWNLTQYGQSFDFGKWDELGCKIAKYGIRNAQVMAIAPTASSGKAINCTESCEPVHDLVYTDEGVRSVITLAPDLKQNAKYYKRAFECDQKALINNAIIRQKYLDQAQSITLYLTDDKVRSLKYLTDLYMYGFDSGIKTFYYQKQTKIDFNQCESCTV